MSASYPFPPTAAVLSVNVARAVPLPEVRSSASTTAIAKLPMAGPVAVHTLGLDGDEVGDTKFHGGPDQAVYAFAREDLDLWSERLGAPLAAGVFGENLTTAGIDVNDAVVGERWRVGSALLQVCSVRTPCKVFQNWLALSGYDASRWMKRFTAEARPGPYLRVLEEGALRAGDPILVESRPAHGVTVSTMFQALTTDRSLLAELALVEDLVEDLPEKVRRKMARSVSNPFQNRPITYR